MRDFATPATPVTATNTIRTPTDLACLGQIAALVEIGRYTMARNIIDSQRRALEPWRKAVGEQRRAFVPPPLCENTKGIDSNHAEFGNALRADHIAHDVYYLKCAVVDAQIDCIDRLLSDLRRIEERIIIAANATEKTPIEYLIDFNDRKDAAVASSQPTAKTTRKRSR